MGADLLTKISEQLADGATVDWKAAQLQLAPELVAQLQQIQALAAGFEGIRPGSRLLASSVEALRHDQLAARFLPILRSWANCRFPAQMQAHTQTPAQAPAPAPAPAQAQAQAPAQAQAQGASPDLVKKTLLTTLARVPRTLDQSEGALLIYLRAELIRALAAQSSGDPENDAADYEEALQKLSAIQREAVVLKFEFGMNFAEIAAALERPNAMAAQSLVARALMAMASILGAP